MKLYIAVCHDRHIDEDVTAHLTREAAIEYARAYMRKHVADPDALAEEDDGERWTMQYEYEEDSAFVVAAGLPEGGGT